MATNYWRDDQGEKPKGYEDAPNPDKGFKGRSSVMEEAVTRISKILNKWLDTPKGDPNVQLETLRGMWILAGGDGPTWESAIQKAMKEVHYCQRMSKLSRR